MLTLYSMQSELLGLEDRMKSIGFGTWLLCIAILGVMVLTCKPLFDTIYDIIAGMTNVTATEVVVVEATFYLIGIILLVALLRALTKRTGGEK